jgi:hypothetical protein
VFLAKIVLIVSGIRAAASSEEYKRLDIIEKWYIIATWRTIMLNKIRNGIFLFSRIALLLSIIINIILIVTGFLSDTQRTIAEAIDLYSKNFEIIFSAFIVLVLSFGTDFVEKKQNIDIPDILEIVILIFIYAGIFLSVQFDLYYTLFWWDDLLHALSGIIMGFIGFLFVYKVNYKFSMDISPLLIAVFSFTFAVTLGVMWEILEFSADVFLGSAHQKWDLHETEKLLGKIYQGSGLRDTMSDLIVDSIGALITSFFTYFMYKSKKKRILDEMEKMVKNEKAT